MWRAGGSPRIELLRVARPLVSFRHTAQFVGDGTTLTSDSTLRFRGRRELTDCLVAPGFIVDEIRDAPDRPGRALVFIAHDTRGRRAAPPPSSGQASH